MKKFVLGFLSCLLVFAFSACTTSTPATEPSGGSVNKTGLPIVDEKITLRGMVALDPNVPDWNTHPFCIELEKRTNIHVEWECVPEDAWFERRNLAFASNELPDFILRAVLSPEDEVKYASTGQIIAIDPLFSDYAPSFSAIMAQEPSVLRNIVLPDGHVYALPQLNKVEGNLIDKYWINKTWLDNLGLSVPETVDEFYNALVAFRDNDPNGNGLKDEIPFSINVSNPRSLIQHFYGAWGFGHNHGILNRPSYIDVDDNGKIRVIAADPRFKEMLTFFNRLWSENLLDHEVFSQSRPQLVAKIETDQIGFSNSGFNNQWMGAKRDNYVAMPALKGPYDSRGHWHMTNPLVQNNGIFVITSANQHPEATMRWIDYFYSLEGTRLVRMGIEGESYDVIDGKNVIKDEILNSPDGLDVALSKWAVYSGGLIPQMIVDEVDGSAAQLPEIKAITEMMRPFLLPYDVFPRPKYTEEESRRLGAIATDLQTYMDESVTKFITGELSLDKFDDFVQQLQKMNMDEYIAIHQAAFDRWKNY